MRTRGVGVGVGLVVLLALGVWRAERSPASGEAHAPASPAASSPAAPKQARSYHPGARTPVPRSAARVTRTSGASASPGSADPAGAPADPPAEGQLRDRREHPPADAKAQLAALHARMEDVDAEIDACLDEWRAIDPDLAGEVDVGFSLDADGLQEAWIADHTDVPFGPLSCFGAAIWSQDWEGITREPAEVTFPFVLGED